MLNPEIFRQYDIRGIAGKDMDEADVVQLGRAIGTYLQRQGNRYIAVGRDCRESSDAYAERIMQGLTASGCRVVDIGLCPTPVLYFANRHLETQGGVMVTASHNPAEYNGFKICSGVDSVYGEQIQVIGRMIAAGDFIEGQGRMETYEILPPYIDYVLENIHLKRPLRVGIGYDGDGDRIGVVHAAIA